MSIEAWGDEGDVGPEGYVTEEHYDELKAAYDRAILALKGAAFMPWGYCLCPMHKGDMGRALDEDHCGECRDVRAAIAEVDKFE